MTKRPELAASGAERRRRKPAPEQPPSLPAEPTPFIKVELDPVLRGWHAQGRFDVAVHGIVTASAPVDQLGVRDPAGAEWIDVRFGQGDAQKAVALPDGTTGFRAAFQVILPLPGGEEARFSDFWMHARATDGAVFEQAVRIGCMDDKAAILAGPIAELAAADPPLPGAVVYLERAEFSATGHLEIHGWAVSLSRIVAVQVFAGGELIAAAAHGRDRADVGTAFPAYPNAATAGFLLESDPPDLAPGIASITVQILCFSGASHTVAIPLVRHAHPVPAPWDLGRAILLLCDSATVSAPDTLRVEGWTWCAQGIARVAIEVDGQPAGDATHGHPRPDVASEYAGMPIETGFAFEQAIPGLSAGRHEVRIVAFSRAGDEKDVSVPVFDPSVPPLRLEIDIPAIRDGIAADPITGRMTIEGWALARDGIAAIEIALDGAPLGTAHYGVTRPDVGAAFPGWDNAVRCGYTFHCPARVLPEGDHTIEVAARSSTGETETRAFRISVKKTENAEAAASIRRRVTEAERAMVADRLRDLGSEPAFALVVMCHGGEGETARRRTILSILRQSWPASRVTLLAAGADAAAALRATIARLAEPAEARFEVIDPSDPVVWQEAQAPDMDLIGFLHLGDELGLDALGAFALEAAMVPSAGVFYADEFRANPVGPRPEAFFKPDFSPTLLLSTNYIGRPFVVRPEIPGGIAPAALMRDGLYDLVLRCTEAAPRVHHVRELLSRTDGGAPGWPADGAAAIAAALARRGIAAEVSAGLVPGTWHARRTAPIAGKVSIIIPTRAAKGHIETCLRTLRATAYRNFEIVCAENIPPEDEHGKAFVAAHADKVLTMPARFNWSRFNNLAAREADGEFLLFLNDDIEIVDPLWLGTMLEDAARPEVGVVGARLLYPNRTVQHAGMFLGINGIARHAFRHAEETEPGYFGLALTKRETIAVTGACLMVRRDVFDRLGGFDEAHDVINNDLDFCLRAHRAGLLTIYTPYATLIHHELASREHLPDDFDTKLFASRWRALFAAGDPYFNPRLSRHEDDYRIDDEAAQAIFPAHPLFDRAGVKRILAVKLDHIGDFIMALPAMRRLKALFPAAELTVLGAPASAVFADAEPAIDRFLPFAFFHARSELGLVDLTRDDLDALTERLTAHRFDIAVDLRKSTATRDILRCSGARILAGFDHLGQFPWLDVGLEWEGDHALHRKRTHVVDDLLSLVGALDIACGTDRDVIGSGLAPMPAEEMPEQARALFARPVVAIHPGVGNPARQWPETHVSDLIDLLIEADDVSILLVGGPDDVPIATALLEQAARRDRVASVAGDVALCDLPRLLRACALYIGNNSGPKHVAAGVGVPTIGIHSGVVDATEWGPVGVRSVALRRNMSCAPCYLARVEDCPRSFACMRLLEPATVHQMARSFLARPVAASPVWIAPADARPAEKGPPETRQPDARQPDTRPADGGGLAVPPKRRTRQAGPA